MVIDNNIDYLIAIAEGRDTLPFDQWWAEHEAQLQDELPRSQFLRLKCQSFDEICRILDERGIPYTKSFANSNSRASRLPMSHDPIEREPSIALLIAQADEMATKELEGRRRGTGFCQLYWRTKKRILKEHFGIDWKTPAEMNPGVFFD